MENLSGKSLMIGDWVRLTDPIAKGMQVQVLAIGRFGSITFKDGITDHIEPIPLDGTTKGLTTEQFTDFLNRVQADVAAEYGIELPQPDDLRLAEIAEYYGL